MVRALMSASLIGHGSQAPLVVLGSRRCLSHASLRSLRWRHPIDAAACMCVTGDAERLAFARASSRAHQTKTASSAHFVQTRTNRLFLFLGLSDHAAASERNEVLVIHMRWRMTASLRATATRARRLPFERTSFRPHVLSGDGLVRRSRSEFAAV